MEIVRSYLRAFRTGFTYDPGHNLYLWFGVLWGLPVPIFSLSLDLSFGGSGPRDLVEILAAHPIHFFFLAHPILFAVVFGAMGTVRRRLEDENLRLIVRLTEMATTDPLTGVHNRRYVLDELERELQRSRRSRAPIAVLLFDLDGFKTVNDLRGHLEGDRVLREAAAGLRSCLREGEVLGRYGGDEFLLVVPGALPEPRRLVERAARAVRERAGVSVSAGVAFWPEDGDSPTQLIAAADVVLSQSKSRRHACPEVQDRV